MAEYSPIGWRALLDELEAQLVRARSARDLAEGIPTIEEIAVVRARFEPLGPMPEHIVGRARQVLNDYDAMIVELHEARRILRDHLSMLRSVSDDRGLKPVYLDRVS